MFNSVLEHCQSVNYHSANGFRHDLGSLGESGSPADAGSMMGGGRELSGPESGHLTLGRTHKKKGEHERLHTKRTISTVSGRKRDRP